MKKIKITDEATQKTIFISLLFFIAVGIFSYTIQIRKPWFGHLSEGGNQWQSGSTLKFVKNWHREGPFKLLFGMIENPDSIEFPTLKSRQPYPSYPPGAILPIYIISKLRGKEPTPSILMRYNLLNHFLIAFFLSLTVFFFLLKLNFGYWASFIFSVIPISLELLLPAPLYFHQNIFFSDEAIILPFVLFIFFEVTRGSIKNKKKLKIINFLQTLVFIYGFLTDWLFLFVALAVYVKRILNKEMGKDISSFLKMSVKFWLPGIIVTSLFFLQMSFLGAIPAVVRKFMFRTGLGYGGESYLSDFFNKFWIKRIGMAYGKVAIVFLWGSLFLFLISIVYVGLRRLRHYKAKEKVKETLSLIGIVLLPCFMQIYFFKNHSVIHYFSVLKFSVPLAVIPFILAPLLVFSLLGKDWMRISPKGLKITYKDHKVEVKLLLIILCLMISVGIYLKDLHPRYTYFFNRQNPDRSYEDIGEFISTHAQYRDIIFSPNLEIPANPPQLLSYAMKRIYKVDSIFDIYRKVKGIKENFEINIFSTINYRDIGSDFLSLICKAYDVREESDFCLYKIKKADFFGVYEEIKGGILEEANRMLESKDPIELNEYKTRFDFIKEIYPEVHKKLNDRLQNLLSDYRSEHVISERVSFVDYRYKKTDKEKYTFYFIFRVKSGFEEDWRIFFHGYVKNEHVALLPPRRQKHGFDGWDFKPDPPTSLWPKEEYIIITKEITAKPIPYDIYIGFHKPIEGRHGEQVKLGWLDFGKKK